MMNPTKMSHNSSTAWSCAEHQIFVGFRRIKSSEQDFKYLCWTISKIIFWNLFTWNGIYMIDWVGQIDIKCQMQYSFTSNLVILVRFWRRRRQRRPRTHFTSLSTLPPPTSHRLSSFFCCCWAAHLRSRSFHYHNHLFPLLVFFLFLTFLSLWFRIRTGVFTGLSHWGSCLSINRLSLLRKHLKRDLQIVRSRRGYRDSARLLGKSWWKKIEGPFGEKNCTKIEKSWIVVQWMIRVVDA